MKLCVSFPFQARTFSGLNLYSLVYADTDLCEFICISLLLCLEDAVSLESLSTSGSYSLSTSSSLRGRGLIKTSHLGLSGPVVDLFIDYHLL